MNDNDFILLLFIGFVGVVVYFILSFVVLSIANNKGRNGCGWALLSLFITPIIVIIILIAIGDSDWKRRVKLKEQAEIFSQYLNQNSQSERKEYQNAQPEIEENQIKKTAIKKVFLILGILFIVFCIVVGIFYIVMQNKNQASNEQQTDIKPQVKTDNRISTQEPDKSYEYNTDVKVNLSQQLLTEKDLLGLSKQELKLMRNEIFARHGYIFNSKDLQEYFSKQSWYRPQYTDVSDKLNSIERQNVSLIEKYEKAAPVIKEITMKECYNILKSERLNADILVFSEDEVGGTCGDCLDYYFCYQDRTVIITKQSDDQIYAREVIYSNSGDRFSEYNKYSDLTKDRIKADAAQLLLIPLKEGRYDFDYDILNRYKF